MSLSFHYLRVREIIKETPEAATIVFEIPDPLQTTFHYLPGQYITVSLILNGQEERRAYSFCSSPFTDQHPAITVKKVADGRVSRYINDELKAGDMLNIMPPMGRFTPEIRPENSIHYVLFAGGSGITPVMSILKSVLNQEPQSRVSLIYANRDVQSIIFNEELNRLNNTHPGRLKVIHCLENPPAGFMGFNGRPGISDYQDITRDLRQEGMAHDYFICGPGGMMDAVKTALEGLQIPAENIHAEYFSAPVVGHEGPSSSEPFEGTATAVILYNGREYEIQIPEGVTVLEAAKDQNVDPPYACQMGVCTTCRAKMLEGSVHMDEREGLSDAEIEDGYVLTCQSHPTSSRLKLIYE